ncbi:hypothetical protein [Streptomyces sp. SCSIO ZS0520]|uniref:hypothetical protein n=1 Tax=Streptomyces sp. SCSIO ZS0520 TaxID=2892996 RepID=UPI0021D9A56A|nr:hypothetical protein [Streptomyces sp. SCSIO ZS0520]
MTVSEIDRLHSQLSRFEGMFPGFEYGKEPTADSTAGRLVVDTSPLPVDPGA